MCEVAERLENIAYAKAYEIGLAKGYGIGYAKGYAIGYVKGLAKGEKKFALLATKLLDDGRDSDVELVAKDEEARKRLYEEYNITDCFDKQYE